MHCINVRPIALRLTAAALCVLGAAPAGAATAMPEAAILRAQAACAARPSTDDRTECEQRQLAGIESYEEKTKRLKPLVDDLNKDCTLEDSEQYNYCVDLYIDRYPEGDRALIKNIAYFANLDRWRKEEEQRQALRPAACKRARIRPDSVRLGMTAAIVRLCGWGEPNSINRTITSWGVSEQWVYGDGRYLYFRNGRLDTIQD